MYPQTRRSFGAIVIYTEQIVVTLCLPAIPSNPIPSIPSPQNAKAIQTRDNFSPRRRPVHTMIPYIHLSTPLQPNPEIPIPKQHTLRLQRPAHSLLRTPGIWIHARQDPATREVGVMCFLDYFRYGDEERPRVPEWCEDDCFAGVGMMKVICVEMRI
jgi:hypothetical protein